MRVELFHHHACPHCARARAFLRELGAEVPQLVVVERNVADDPVAREQFLARARALGSSRPAVPLFDVCGTLLVGFDDEQTTGLLLRGLVSGASAGHDVGTGGEVVQLPLLGSVSVDRWGLPAFTVAVGLLDGFNPCAMWVLLFLLSILVHLRRRSRILLVAGTFVLVSALVYFAFMAAWLEAFLLIGYSRTLEVVLGVVALCIAAVQLKDFVMPGMGPSLSIPEGARPGIFARVRAVVQAENLPVAVLSVAALAVMVNLLELLCTAGLPALYTEVLSRQALPTAGQYAYLALYNLAYVLDDALMVALVTWTLRRARLQARAGRWLKLASGAAVGLLGTLLLVRPDWLA